MSWWCGSEFDPEGWDIWSAFWDAAVLRIQERLHASLPPLLARRLETPDGLPGARSRLARAMVRLLAEKERLAAALAEGDDPGDLAAREAAFRKELDAVEAGR